jgi:hypothetical protein
MSKPFGSFETWMTEPTLFRIGWTCSSFEAFQTIQRQISVLLNVIEHLLVKLSNGLLLNTIEHLYTPLSARYAVARFIGLEDARADSYQRVSTFLQGLRARSTWTSKKHAMWFRWAFFLTIKKQINASSVPHCILVDTPLFHCGFSLLVQRFDVDGF